VPGRCQPVRHVHAGYWLRPRRRSRSPGEQLRSPAAVRWFAAIGCALCHTPALQTAPSRITPSLSQGQRQFVFRFAGAQYGQQLGGWRGARRRRSGRISDRHLCGALASEFSSYTTAETNDLVNRHPATWWYRLRSEWSDPQFQQTSLPSRSRNLLKLLALALTQRDWEHAFHGTSFAGRQETWPRLPSSCSHSPRFRVPVASCRRAVSL